MIASDIFVSKQPITGPMNNHRSMWFLLAPGPERTMIHQSKAGILLQASYFDIQFLITKSLNFPLGYGGTTESTFVMARPQWLETG